MSTAKPVALITGRAKGIGRAIARHLVFSGWQTSIIDLPDSGVRRAFARERNAFIIEGDVRDEETAFDAVAATVHRYGRLDGVVSNAGIMIRKPALSVVNKIKNLAPDSARFHVAYVAENSLWFSTVLIH